MRPVIVMDQNAIIIKGSTRLNSLHKVIFLLNANGRKYRQTNGLTDGRKKDGQTVSYRYLRRSSSTASEFASFFRKECEQQSNARSILTARASCLKTLAFSKTIIARESRRKAGSLRGLTSNKL